MNKLMMVAGAAMVGAMVTGCATSGLKEEAKNEVNTALWYDNATLLVDANDPDLTADATTKIPSIDGPLNTVKDIIAIVPMWTVARVEEKHFENCYMQSSQAINAGADDADLVVKGEAFKTALLMDTFADEKSQADAAAKAVDYANNQIYPFQKAREAGNAECKAFFADASRKQWDAKTDEFVAKIRNCVNKAENNEAAAKAAKAKLCKEMGVRDVDWKQVATRLAGDLQKLQSALTTVTTALADADLATKIAAASFGAEIVPGTSAKETLGAIDRTKKQLEVSIRLVGWLMKSVVI